MDILKENELRIGSFVNYRGMPNIVLGIFPPSPTNDRFNDSVVIQINPPDAFNVRLDELRKTPLTEEWLLKLGFEQNGDISYKLRKTGFVILVFGGIFKHNVTGKEFKYVHKLQNFYYELNDEELTFNQNG